MLGRLDAHKQKNGFCDLSLVFVLRNGCNANNRTIPIKNEINITNSDSIYVVCISFSYEKKNYVDFRTVKSTSRQLVVVGSCVCACANRFVICTINK